MYLYDLRITGFPGQIDQVFMNLITNAAQAVGSRDQGGTVRVVHIPGSRASTVVGQIPDSGATVEQGETVTIYAA